MKLPNKVYDILKWIVITLIPATITFLGVIFPIVGLEYDLTSNIVTIISAIGTFVGALIGISSYNYNSQEEDEYGNEERDDC